MKILKSDITKLKVDAIVNAANNSLRGGGGVDGAIHKAAGSELLVECIGLKGCKTGEAKITKAYNLPCKYVIHTVGPVWSGGENKEDHLLKNCYRNSLKIAVVNNIKSIAFSAISTGVYGFPIERACRIAVEESSVFLKTSSQELDIIFVCFNDNVYNSYQKVFMEKNLIKE
jgi:O-acetyl-ADP-ribose deacetylase